MAAGLTQQTLATRAGLSTKTVNTIETGGDTTVGTLTQIADVLGCTVPELLAGDDQPEAVEAAAG